MSINERRKFEKRIPKEKEKVFKKTKRKYESDLMQYLQYFNHQD